MTKMFFTILICSFCNQAYATAVSNVINESCYKKPPSIIQNSFSMLNNTKKEICISYLRRYENKDLKGIEEMFANDIILRDWKIRVEGKESALRETQKNFESVESIKIDVLSLYENDNTVAAELKIVINNKDELYVVDVITINTEGKICSIKAFIGRGDN